MVFNFTELQLPYRTPAADRMQHVDTLSRNILIIEPLSFEQVLVYKQLQDPTIIKIHKQLEKQESNQYELRDGVVYRKHNQRLLFYVPEAMSRNVIQASHDDIGHVELEKNNKFDHENLLVSVHAHTSKRNISITV